MRTVAALFVYNDPRGSYWGVPGVELWGEAEDARKYAGPHPVICHSPCSRWCQLAPINAKRYGQKVGDDGGCFASALASVRRWGGVLEHPAKSYAWAAFDLPRPRPSGGWQRGMCGGWSCHVEQGNYGHAARKATWLYAFGLTPPELVWGRATGCEAIVSWCANHTSPGMEGKRRIGKRAASHTPEAFRDVLLEMARAAKP